MPDFPIPKGFHKDSSKHCSALFIVKPEIDLKPSDIFRNGTVSFIECNGLTYGVTCKHVVEGLRRKKKELNDPNLAFATFVQRNIIIADRFKLPKSDDPFTQEPPDVAIQQIHPDLCMNIGKKPFHLSSNDKFNIKEMTHGVAVGFPEEKKSKINCSDYNGYQLSMPCAYALGEIKSLRKDKLILANKLDTNPEANNLSGMSGGPIFWTNESEYGLLGINRKALPTIPKSEEGSDESLGGKPRVCIKGERINYERFCLWIKSLDLTEPLFDADKTLEINFKTVIC